MTLKPDLCLVQRKKLYHTYSPMQLQAIVYHYFCDLFWSLRCLSVPSSNRQSIIAPLTHPFKPLHFQLVFFFYDPMWSSKWTCCSNWFRNRLLQTTRHEHLIRIHSTRRSAWLYAPHMLPSVSVYLGIHCASWKQFRSKQKRAPKAAKVHLVVWLCIVPSESWGGCTWLFCREFRKLPAAVSIWDEEIVVSCDRMIVHDPEY